MLIKPGTRYYDSMYSAMDVRNPRDISGQVDADNNPGELPLGVIWDNGYHNAYSEKDLVLDERYQNEVGKELLKTSSLED